MLILLQLKDYGRTQQELLRFLNDIRRFVHERHLLNYVPREFTARSGARHWKYPIAAFDLAMVLQHWEREGKWIVQVVDYPSWGDGFPCILVCRKVLENKLRPLWTKACSELVDERQISFEDHKALRTSFRLTPVHCQDTVFFQDVYGVA